VSSTRETNLGDEGTHMISVTPICDARDARDLTDFSAIFGLR
jgi:hypothetical protein